MNREPAAIVAAITATVAAILTLLAALGLSISEELETAIIGVIAVVAPLVVGAFTRGLVTPARQVAAKRQSGGKIVAGEAAEQDPGTVVRVDTVG